ncbi:MAG: ABC transporter substrate-binding protein [Chloroflexota bacterium]|nr:ABC transporter substrate-binding protein [Chloroflexota bacterium]
MYTPSRIRSILGVIVLAALVLALTSAVGAQDTRGVLRHAKAGASAANDVDPHGPNPEGLTMQYIYSQLTRLDMGATYVVPDLAESWESDDTGQVWTFHLRQGVTFHDGSDFTSADALYSIRRVLDPDTGSPIRDKYAIIDEANLAAPDDYTIVIPLHSVNVEFPTIVADRRLAMIPEGSGDTIAQTGIGTDAFRLVEQNPVGITVLEAFDDYWDGPPGLARIELYHIGDAAGVAQALLTDQLDYVGIGSIRAENFPLFEGNDDFTFLVQASGGQTNLVMDATVAPYDDIRVRQAFKLVLDRQEILEVVYAGQGDIACDNSVWKNDPYYLEQDCPRDVERAKELLAEAGYPDGLDVELFVADVYPSYVPLAVAFKEQAAEAGIRVEINQVPNDTYYSDYWKKVPFYVTWWGQRMAGPGLKELFSCDSPNNYPGWCNEEFDQLLADASAELDFDKRKELYAQAQILASEGGGWLNPVFFTAVDLFNSRVKGVTRMFTAYIHLFYIEED